MIKIIQLLVLCLTLTLVVFIFVKIKKNSSIPAYSGDSKNGRLAKKYKFDFFLSNGNWEYKFKDDKLNIGKNYFLIEFISDYEKCFLGTFFLKKITDNNIFFSSLKKLNQSKLSLYATVYSKKVKTYVISENKIDSEVSMLESCDNWVKV